MKAVNLHRLMKSFLNKVKTNTKTELVTAA
jgi:hypothetical protein